jgi:glycosyltransferase involved in cell wall biosynthesis
MHILLIHQSFVALDEPGGTRHYEMAEHLAQRGHRVTIIASPVSYLTGTIQGKPTRQTGQIAGNRQVTLLRAYTYSGLHRSFVHRVLSFLSFMISSFWIGLRVPEVDLVWGTSPPIFQGATAWGVARLKRAAFLFEVRDLWPAFAVAVGVLRQPLLVYASEWLEKFLYRHADTVMINSPGFEQHVRARGARQVELVPNGADTAMFSPGSDGAAFRQVNGLEGRFIVLYAGAHGISNDLTVVLEAAKILHDRPEIAIVLVGDGKEKEALKTRAIELGLSNVYFIPPVPKKEMPQVLAAADACLGILKPIPLYATVYPNKIFDYLAAGRPVVLAMQGVIREVIEKSGAGIPVPPGNATAIAQAILTLADDPKRGRAMGLCGRHYVEQYFDRPHLADRLVQLIERTVKSR